MTERLITSRWLALISQHPRWVVAYSGGIDSSVLLHALCQHRIPSIEIIALHINHGLSRSANDWERHCRDFCEQLEVDCFVDHVSIVGRANLECRAREARYQSIKKFVREGDAVLMAHHALDQTETFLLNALRGSGIEGLSAIPPTSNLGKARLYRPLLECPKSSIDDYQGANQLHCVEDESNADTRFNRNYLRHTLLPVLRSRWPQFEKSFVRSARHCQQAKKNLATLGAMDSADPRGAGETSIDVPAEKPSVVAGARHYINNEPWLCSIERQNENEGKRSTLSLEKVTALPIERQINTLRQWFIREHIQCPSNSVMQCIIRNIIAAKEDAMPTLSWGNTELRRYQSLLYLLPKTPYKPLTPQRWKDFPHVHCIAEWGQYLAVSHPPPLLFTKPIMIRRREGGESIVYRGHTRSLKNLMQTWKIPPWERDKIPLLFLGEALIAVVGYASTDALPAHCEFYLGKR